MVITLFLWMLLLIITIVTFIYTWYKSGDSHDYIDIFPILWFALWAIGNLLMWLIYFILLSQGIIT